jgi:hypothetical protein
MARTKTEKSALEEAQAKVTKTEKLAKLKLEKSETLKMESAKATEELEAAKKLEDELKAKDAKERTLKKDEKDRLEVLVKTVNKGKAVYREVGNALNEIKDKKLYREKGTFEDFCKAEFGFSRFSGYDYMNAAKVASNLKTVEKSQQMSFSQAVKLSKLTEDEQRKVAATVDFMTATLVDLAEEIKKHVPKVEVTAPAPTVKRVLFLVGKANTDLEKTATDVLKLAPDADQMKELEKMVVSLQNSLTAYKDYLAAEAKKAEEKQEKSA